MRAQPTISVVVPTYRRERVIEEILRPLLDDPVAEEVIVVVDGSPDGTFELLQGLAAAEPRLRPIRIENSGEMAARSAGAQVARGDVVLFLDDDVLAEPGLAAGHARRHATGSADLVLGYMPVRLPPRRRPGDFAARLYDREYEGRCARYERDADSVLRELWAGNFSIRRERCLAVGMTNPRFSALYHADRDFGIRCLEAGLRGEFDRSLRAAHLYERPLDAFVRDGRRQGAARVLMTALHRETIGPLDRDEFDRNLPGGLDALVRLSRRRRACTIVTASLTRLIQATGRLHLWTLQNYGARVLRRIVQQRGAIDQLHALTDG